jgi:hypothetical protein
MSERSDTFGLLCTGCYGTPVPAGRLALGYTTCLTCGEKAARAVKHTIAPLNKSNYVLVTDHVMLKQLNPKRTT